MTDTGNKNGFRNILPWIMIICACCFLAFLLATIRPCVFYSGDAGLKLVIVQQILKTGNYKTLTAVHPGWVEGLWNQGFYPFKPPFVYNNPEGRVVAFPPLFQWINAPFLNVFGFKGMYLIPAISLVLLWIWLLVLLSRSGVLPFVSASALFFIAFCSPLTLYGATYWEHCTACFMLFGSIVFLVRNTASYSQSALLGLLSGLAVWLRPEAIVFNGLFLVVALYNFYRNRNLSSLYFVLACLAAMLGFLVFNQAAYGHFFGAHGMQVLGETVPESGLSGKLRILTHINARLLLYFPLAVLFFGMAFYLFFRKPDWPAALSQLVCITLAYLLVTPFILPNGGGKQWGPRYFLPVIPLMLVAISLGVKYFEASALQKKIALVLIVSIVAYSVHLNVYQAARHLEHDYAFRVLPGMKYVQEDSCRIVVVQNQFIAQEFAALFTSKYFFRAEDQESFSALAAKLRSAGISRVIYITVEDRRNALPASFRDTGLRLERKGVYYFGNFILP